MLNKLVVSSCFLTVTTAFVWVAACSSDSARSPTADSGSSSSGSSSGGEGGGSSGSSGAPRDGGVSDADFEAGGGGLLVDDMTATIGTQISLQVPAGATPGSYYVYSDFPLSNTIGTGQLVDVPVSPPVQNHDGSRIVGELCLGGGDGSEAGTVGGFAGLGMSLAYGQLPDAATPGCDPSFKPPIPFDASKYGGVSFYVFVDSFTGPMPSMRFNVPDIQTGDHCVKPTPLCVGSEAACYDDFGADIPFTAGSWTKVEFKWSDLSQGGWGDSFPALKTNQLIGMKWQVNGPGADAAAEAFRFCISDIYFTP